MYARHTHVVEAGHAVAHDLGRDRRFLGHVLVGRAAGGDHDVAECRTLGAAVHEQDPRLLEVAGVGGHLRHLLEVRGARARAEEHLSMLEDLPGDGAHLRR